jgi:hypothetical protein
MPQQPPRRRPNDGKEAREPPWDSSSLDKPPDISDMETVYLVPYEPLQGIGASREEQLKAHHAAGDHLRAQQLVLVRQVADWQKHMQVERSADRRARMQVQVDNLWARWGEMERQVRAHRQAERTLRESDPPA